MHSKNFFQDRNITFPITKGIDVIKAVIAGGKVKNKIFHYRYAKKSQKQWVGLAKKIDDTKWLVIFREDSEAKIACYTYFSTIESDFKPLECVEK